MGSNGLANCLQNLANVKKPFNTSVIKIGQKPEKLVLTNIFTVLSFFCYKTFFFLTVYQCTIRTTFIFAYLLIVRSNCQCLLDQRKSKRVPEKHLFLLY